MSNHEHPQSAYPQKVEQVFPEVLYGAYTTAFGAITLGNEEVEFDRRIQLNPDRYLTVQNYRRDFVSEYFRGNCYLYGRVPHAYDPQQPLSIDEGALHLTIDGIYGAMIATAYFRKEVPAAPGKHLLVPYAAELTVAGNYDEQSDDTITLFDTEAPVARGRESAANAAMSQARSVFAALGAALSERNFRW